MKKLAKFRHAAGLTLVEMVLAAATGIVVSLVIGMLLYGSQKNWTKTFAMSHKGIEVDALKTQIAFGAAGRKSNKMNYRLYHVAGNTFNRALPASLPAAGTIITGDAVEFRYWDRELTRANEDLIDTDITGTAYMLFYYNAGSKQLLMDNGPYNWQTGNGGVIGNQRNPNAEVRVVADHVDSVEFSHTAKNNAGDGDGSVRMNIVFSDPNNSRTITIKTTTLLRNVWGLD